MKKMIITIFLILLTLKCMAPEYRVIYIKVSKATHTYKPLIRAVTWVESKWGVHVWNAKERAVGWFQIRQIRVDDYNKRTKSNYKLTDFYNYNLSEQMFLYYAKGKTYEQAAKSWNGSGPKTITYWQNVQLALIKK